MNGKEHEQTLPPSSDQSADRALLTFLLKVGGLMLTVLLAAALLIGGLVALAVRNAWTNGTLAD